MIYAHLWNVSEIECFFKLCGMGRTVHTVCMHQAHIIIDVEASWAVFLSCILVLKVIQLLLVPAISKQLTTLQLKLSACIYILYTMLILLPCAVQQFCCKFSVISQILGVNLRL